ncbi:hypothetical protein [Agrobacterium rosae]|nr:hypothetical protein [Agrobacterium rosae]
MTDQYKPRYKWKETWPGEGHEDYSGWDGPDIIGRLQIVMGGKWLWAAGHASWILKRVVPHTGYIDTAREAAKLIEEYHDAMKASHGRTPNLRLKDAGPNPPKLSINNMETHSLKITIVGLQGQTPSFDNAEELIAASAGLGITHIGTEDQTHLLPHLIGLPKFKELAGPMGNGEKDGVSQVRYETWEAYDLLSR